MTETFDAVLAEVDKAFGMVACNGSVAGPVCNEMKRRLAAAHAAEKSAWFLRAREEAERCGQAEARAEAAEARVRELEANAADRFDARRYRWLAVAEDQPWVKFHFQDPERLTYGPVTAINRKPWLDAAIDAAIAATEQAAVQEQ